MSVWESDLDAALRLGPIALPLQGLIWVIAFWLALWVHAHLVRRYQLPRSHAFTLVFVIGLLAARAAFVWAYPQSYATHPLAIFNVRDGGWVVGAGFAAAAVVIGLWAKKRP